MGNSYVESTEVKGVNAMQEERYLGCVYSYNRSSESISIIHITSQNSEDRFLTLDIIYANNLERGFMEHVVNPAT